jgi:hypothetical protein
MRVTRHWLRLLLMLALTGCHHRPPALSEVGPEQACAGQLVLEFTNHLAIPVQVGWIPEAQLTGDPGLIAPTWLGVVDRETARYDVVGPGRVIFRTANPEAVDEDRHHVSHRLLCRPV